ncbi:MAG: hypothetical protein LBF04_06435 [Prevotellaceae bacterium]|nr:hypothetical protein [Prevotellaceae bacterium]
MLVKKTVAYTPRELPTALFRIPLGMHRSVKTTSLYASRAGYRRHCFAFR